MARQESDREDLLREAATLVQRAEFQINGYDQPIVIGFRRDGAGSIFLGAAPVYQFNAAGQLRRAYWREMLVKAEAGSLISLERHRTAERVELVRHTLSAEETQAFLAEFESHQRTLGEAFACGRFSLVGQVPAAIDIVSRIQAWLQALPHPPTIAARPNAGG
jgi:hypothetical protein